MYFNIHVLIHVHEFSYARVFVSVRHLYTDRMRTSKHKDEWIIRIPHIHLGKSSYFNANTLDTCM